MNTKIKDTIVPNQYIPQFKAAISLLNVSEHFENSFRTYYSLVRISPTLMKFGNVSCPRKADPVEELNKLADVILPKIKDFNSIIEQVHFKKSGKDDINNMQYNLVDMIDKIYYLSLENQEKVSKFVDSLK